MERCLAMRYPATAAKTSIRRHLISKTMERGCICSGNSWKQLNVPYDVTPDTVIEFDFQSNVEGEIQAIGFDTNGVLNTSDHFFQLFGAQAWWGNQDYHDYSVGQGLRHYVIPIGQYFTGSFSRLVLANDDDAGISADSLFSSIQIHQNRLNIVVDGVTSSYVPTSYGGQDQDSDVVCRRRRR